MQALIVGLARRSRSRTSDSLLALQLFDKMQIRGFSPGEPTNSDSDEFWLSKLDHRDWVAPNQVLKIFSAIANPRLLFPALNKLSLRRDYKPSEALFSLLLRKLAMARDYHSITHLLLPTIKSQNCTISDDFFFQAIKILGIEAHHAEAAIKTLTAMPEFNCWPSLRTFNFVLNLLVNSNQYDSIPKVFLSAPRLGVELDTCSFNILIKGHCKSGDLAAARHLFEEMPKQRCTPNVTSFSTLMDCLCKRGRLDEAFEVYARMEVEGCSPDAVIFNILISGLCREGRVGEGMELLKKMKLRGCYPNGGTYQALLYGLIDAGRFVEGKKFMGLMRGEGHCPSFLSYKRLIGGLCGEGRKAEVEEVLKEMVGQGFVPRMGTWREIVGCLELGTEGSEFITDLMS